MHIELIPARDLPNCWNALVTLPDHTAYLDTRNYTSRTQALRAYIPNHSATHITTVTPQAAAPAPKHMQTGAQPTREFFPSPIKAATDVAVHELVDSHGAPCAWTTEIARLTAKLSDPKLSYRDASRTRALIVSAEMQMQLHYENAKQVKQTSKTKRETWLDNAAKLKTKAAKNAKRRAAYAASKRANAA